MRRLIISILILLYSAALTWGRPYKFMLSDKNLSSCLINSIYQDSDGMIWISTENGLNRYDGTKVTTYKHNDEDPHSIAHNYVRYVYEDKAGNFYVGSYIGLQIYHRDTDDFSPIGTFSDGQPLLSSPSYIAELPDGSIYTSGNQTCSVTIEQGVPVFHDVDWVGFDTSMSGEMICDKHGTLWCQKMNDDVFSITPAGRLEYHRGIVPTHDISGLLRDNEGNIYLHTIQHDLYRHDFEHDTWHKVNASRISSAALKCIYRLDQEQILVGTDGNGIKLVNEQTGEVSDYLLDLPALTSRYLKVHQIMRDHEGDLWVALFLKGIAHIPMRKSSFHYMGSQSLTANLIGSSSISALLPDRAGQIWVGTDGEGLYRIDPTLTASHHYISSTDGGSMPAIVQTIYEDSHGTIWIGSYGEGCGRIDPASGRYTSCQDLFRRKDAVAQRFYDFTEDHQNRLWAATLGHGIFCYDLTTHRLIDELSFGRGKVNLWATCLLITTDDHLLIGTYDGVYAIDLNASAPEPRHVFDRSIVFSLFEDQQQRLWAGGSTGLTQFSLSTDSITTITAQDGLAGNAVYSILGDDSLGLWIGTDHGLTHYQPDTHIYNNYSVADGLQGNEFSKNVSCRDQQGRLWFGGAYGISYFDPQDVSISNTPLHTRITGFYIDNEPIHASTLSGGKPIISEALVDARQFTLAHADNRFTIELSTVEFSDPDVMRYEYSLDGHHWTALPLGSHLVSFSGLQPGHYTFGYKVTDGQVESDMAQVDIVIRPAWWESSWAWLSYILLAISAILIYMYQHSQKQKAEREILTQQHKHEIDEAKLRFFTNITHEIRTPMTLIMSPLQKLINTDSDPARQSDYQTMLRNARMLLQLANQLLDLRKIDNKQMKLVFSQVNIIDQLQNLYLYFQPYAEQKNLLFFFEHKGLDTLPAWVDPGYFNKIITNLLTNAFKYTREGSVQMSVQVVEGETPMYKIDVTDSGIGIQEEDLERIFERFYRAKSAHASAEGNGIGLHLTRTLVSLHHGTIHAMCNDSGVGTTFSVLLPLGKQHLKEEEISTPPIEPDHNELLQMEEPATVHSDTEKPAARTKYRLMLVDDDAEIRTYLKKELSADFHIIECQNGQEALQRIFKQKPDLVISDVMMPEIDGMTLCQKIKGNIQLNDLPVILLTAKADQESNLAGLQSGADAYVTKPFYIEILRSTALNLVKTRSQLRNSLAGKQAQEDKLSTIEMPTANDKLMERVMRVVNQNLSNTEFSIDDICQEVGISRVHLYRKLKELTNQSPRDFIRNIRLKQAERLLLKGSYSINEIADAVGFSRANNFSAAFKEQYGYSPLQWKAMQKQEESAETDEKKL